MIPHLIDERKGIGIVFQIEINQDIISLRGQRLSGNLNESQFFSYRFRFRSLLSVKNTL